MKHAEIYKNAKFWNINKLIDKLKFYGFNFKAINFIKSYFNVRQSYKSADTQNKYKEYEGHL